MTTPAPRQFTARAALLGVLLGAPLAATNIYVGLKTGWIFGVALTAGLLARLVAGARLSLLEINCAQSTASSAGFATGNALVGAIPAAMMLAPAQHLPLPWLVTWIALSATFGVALAWLFFAPLASQPELPFPSATAAASMLSTLSRNVAVARSRIRALVLAFFAAAGVTLARETKLIGARVSVFDVSPLLLAAGGLIGLRTCAWLAAGGIVTAHALPTRDLGVWLGAPLLVTFALLSTLPRLRIGGVSGASNARERVIVGSTLAGCGVSLAALSHHLFGVPWLLSAAALLLSIVLSAAACRAVAETDVAPGGALSKLTQLLAGTAWPQLPVATVMTGALTHASASSCADCVNDLKCGQLLGADARQQLLAQALGVVPGAIAAVFAFNRLVPDRAALADSDAFPAPAAHQLRAVALVMQHGLDGLSSPMRLCVIAGAAIGVALCFLERIVPDRRVVPSAVGLGIGLFLPLAGSLTMCLGALLLRRRQNDEVCAGAMLGESVVAIAATVWSAS